MFGGEEDGEIGLLEISRRDALRCSFIQIETWGESESVRERMVVLMNGPWRSRGSGLSKLGGGARTRQFWRHYGGADRDYGVLKACYSEWQRGVRELDCKWRRATDPYLGRITRTRELRAAGVVLAQSSLPIRPTKLLY
jgi:hypothetical protein